jgi:hypothetical protein
MTAKMPGNLKNTTAKIHSCHLDGHAEGSRSNDNEAMPCFRPF